MRILMLTPYLPYPPASGGQIRTYNLLKYLAKDHDITLVCLYKTEKEKTFAKDLEGFCKEIHLCKRPEKPWQISSILKSVFGRYPFLIVRNYSSEAAKKIKELLEKETYDVIHVETFYVMPHIPQTDIPILLVEQTIEYRVYAHFIKSLPWLLSQALRIDTFKLRYWERKYWQKAELVCAVSEADATEIRTLEPSLSPIVVPNGAGDDMFNSTRNEPADKEPVKLLFTGNFSWLQNIEAAEYLLDKIMPQLASNKTMIQLVLAGQNIPTNIKSSASKSVTIVDTGSTDDAGMKKLYEDATIFVAPIFGPGGTRLKILTAMATRLPVVSTPIGTEGLDLVDGESCLVADTPERFVEKINLLITEPSLRKSIADKAHEIARTHFSWSSISQKLASCYNELQHAHRH